MKILYYCWDEITAADFIDVVQKMGYALDIFKYPINDKLNDENFATILKNKISSKCYDCIFTFNFFPIISKVAEELHIKYVSWIYDSPHLTLYSTAVFNSYNYIFHFDSAEVFRLQSAGVTNIYHMPLAVNVEKYKKLGDFSAQTDITYEHNITFLGSLYNDQYNFYDQIKSIPDYYRGFFDCIINTQMNIFGYDLASDLIRQHLNTATLNTFAAFNLDKEIFADDMDIFIQIIQKKITNVERINILNKLSEAGFSVSHYGPTSDASLRNVKFHGYADYDRQMPHIFRNSKINLNISLRSILSGIPLRCLDIMASGGFLISNYQPELAEYFENGIDLVMYESLDDLLTKTEYYLSHGSERKEIAYNGRNKDFKHLSYENQLQRIFDILT